MRFTLLLALAIAAGAALGSDRPLIGDVVHGELLLKKARAGLRVDGAWMNAVTDEQALVKLARGSDGFPRIETDNVLDRWDALAALRSHNADLRDMAMSADTVLIMKTKINDDAHTRLTEQAKIAPAAIERQRRVFGLYDVDPEARAQGALEHVGEKDSKRRDKLKKNTKVGYVVFLKIPGFRDGNHEVAFAVDKDIRVQQVTVRAPDGTVPVDLNQAAARFLGKGARGQYAALKAGGAGKAIGELERPLSDAFLVAMESVYMFEVAEREYFAFDD